LLISFSFEKLLSAIVVATLTAIGKKIRSIITRSVVGRERVGTAFPHLFHVLF